MVLFYPTHNKCYYLFAFIQRKHFNLIQLAATFNILWN